MTMSTPQPSPVVVPTQQAASPAPLTPQGEKPKKKSQQPSFIGAGAEPSGGGATGKTLLGQ